VHRQNRVVEHVRQLLAILGDRRIGRRKRR
jgi:hypothetical protein